jgi:glycerol-1-phosphate dehydrogenase [NAD(P)+]
VAEPSRGPLRSVAIPRLLHVGPGSLESIAELLAAHGFDTGRVLLGSGRGPSQAFAATVRDSCLAAGLHVIEVTDLAGRLTQAAELASRIISEQVTVAVAVGGGRVIDTVKLATARTSTDFVSVPTTIAHDGISSPVASLDTDGRRVSHAASMPAGIVVDTTVIGRAPARTLRAGVGDLVSNLTAILDWQLADSVGADRYDAFCGLIAESAARPALDITDLGTAADHEVLAKGLLLSGLAMAAAGTSRPCSGAEHLISHSLDGLLDDRAALHGEQVALGCLVSAAAHESPLLDQLRQLFARLELPTDPAALGITTDEMRQAITQAPGTRPDRYTVLDATELTADRVEHLMKVAFG